jgi:Tfp pilus assembly protein PilN
VIADQMGKGWEEAEHLKVSLGELDPTIDRRTDPLAYGEGETKARVKVFVSKAFEGITNEIKRTLDFYVSQPEGEPIGRILLTGGTACCPGIAHFIEERLGIPCEVKNPLEGSLVAFNPQVSSNEGFATNSAIIIGQCQRNIANVPLRMTFLPPPIVHLKDFQRRRPLLVLEGIGLAAFIGFSVVTMGKTIEVYNQATDRLMVNIDGPDDNARQIREFITSTSKIEERVEYLREIGLSRGVVSQTMAEIAEKIPLGKTWVDSVDIDTTEIKLHMRGNNEQSVNPFKDQMKDVARLREMTVPEVKVLGSEGIEFLMSAKVEKNPSIELTKLREKLEVRDILALDVSLEDHSENPGAKQRAAIRVVVIEPFSEAERDELVLKILRAEDEAQLGFESKSIAIVFNDKKRKDRGQYDISHEELQSLIQGKSGVKDLTLKEPEVTAEETPAMTGMEGMTGEAGVGMEGMGMGMGMGMGGMGMGGMVPPDGASTGTEAAPAD